MQYGFAIVDLHSQKDCSCLCCVLPLVAVYALIFEADKHLKPFIVFEQIRSFSGEVLF